ncbi:serine hydrolase domain-containing protein [Kitasatospora viridis]|nr:serine hydrolase domain-containing protein [Kitasatospora viridis]
MRSVGALLALCTAAALVTPAAVADAAGTTGAGRHAGRAPAASAAPPFAAGLTADLTAEMQRLRVPGAIVAVRTPQWGTWTTALGTSDLATGAPMALDNHMRIGSITKTMVGTVILQLVHDKLLTLDEAVSELRPEVPNGNHITIRELLQMTSGLFNYTEDRAFNETLDSAPQTQWTPQQVLDIAFRHEPCFPPGTKYQYSNTNTILLGLIIEQLTQHSLEQELQERIFDPLHLAHSSLPQDTTRMPVPYAHGYQFLTNIQSLDQPVLTGDAAALADWKAGNPRDVTRVNTSWAWAAGGVVSDLDDMLAWAPALATGTLLPPELQRERLTFVPTTDNPDGPAYGLAIARIGGFLGHTGTLSGYQSFEGYDPVRQATVVVLVNLNQSPDASTPADRLTMRIVADLFQP